MQPQVLRTHAVTRLLWTRGLRGFADGMVSVGLASYLGLLGYSGREIGAIVTATLLGSAALTLLVGLAGGRFDLRRLLLAASLLMAATGLGFATVTGFVPLLVIAFVGTLNPSAGDVSVFLPTEQTLLAHQVQAPRRTFFFGLYNVIGSWAGALGALAAGLPAWLGAHPRSARPLAALVAEPLAAQRSAFVIYALIGACVAAVYWALPSDSGDARPRSQPLSRSRAVVLRLAALFCLDSWGGGFVVQALLALWLYRRFQLSVETTAGVFFGMGLLAGFSQLLSGRLAARIGHIRTMVYTHLPANMFLIAAAFMPNATAAIACLLARMALAQMDVPARQAYVMAVVPAEERPAAASVSNVPRSLAAALSPFLAGWLLEASTFGWPLIIAGATKILYDLLLLQQFHAHVPRDEA